jgi:hypothetical protein
MTETQKFVPLETLEFLPSRIIESVLFSDGKLSEDQLPVWVRQIGRKLLSQLPKRVAIAAGKSPRNFANGLLAGMSLTAQTELKISEMLSAANPRMDRAVRTIDHPDAHKFSTQKAVEKLRTTDTRKAIRKETLAALQLATSERQAYFEGFAMGLNITEEIKAFRFGRMSERVALHLYLWLRWPEIIAAGSIPAAYQRCRTAFATTNAAYLVGSEHAFKKFCHRHNIRFRRQQSQKQKKP